ncbi:efflux RND transporter permease subunit [Microcystis aeruginosa CS-558/01A06]|uniref:Efflux RND transporter permease subunit n=1 Tax=Microcystis aeruginosa BLCC-F108 TaxID=2755317 RepID=A0A841URF3_MICAE|nr:MULTISPECIES: efflux RND transporter permease subunit [Microcystis]MBC1193571.1 efflux RND transporter permease subunit [Microcystis aeruginosa BLCC-F108]MCA2592711.1 efflux RND transporter permease subunit [Microcystis sp. M31BS1]MDB9409185.1 efflux RND transporter permease subunit [Microcystis aeruginosa CS-558/01A06]
MILSIADTFIKRPVLTTVCSILIVLIGAIAIPFLPLEKLPQLAFIQVAVNANYLGTDAKTVQDNVTTVLDRQINGTEQIVYMQSQSTNTGQSTVNVFFPVEMDRNIAQVLVQNRVSTAAASLPEEVNRQGVTTNTQSPSVTLAYGISAKPDEKGNYPYDTVFLSNFVDRVIDAEIRRIEGVGSTTIIGEREYALRFWLNPDALAARGVSADEVVQAIREQNIQVGAGTIGGDPSPEDQEFQIAIRAVGRVATGEEAENIVVKVGENGDLIRIKDVGRAEIGAENYSTAAYFDKSPAVVYIVYQLPGSNAWNTAKLVKEKMAELEPSFPPGLNIAITLDNTAFVAASLEEAVGTLVEAILLVILVIFIFLQDWRTTIIPAIAIPVSLIGTMAVALALGYSLNNLSLFAVILATGLVVDDGIVVVEAVSEKLRQGMRPFQAALDAMGELTSAVIASSLVLFAVFIPVTFFPGTVGIVYRQFAVIISASILISTFNALSFSPTMSAIIMKPPQGTRGPLGLFFEGFNRGFNAVKEGYRRLIEFLIRVRFLVLPFFIAALFLTAWSYSTTPQGFIPEEDQGYAFVLVQAPPGVSLRYTDRVIRQINEEILAGIEEVEHFVGMAGFSFAGSGSNQGLFFVKLKEWSERTGEDKSVFGILRKINRELATKVRDARAFAVNAPPVDGLSSTGGFELFIQNRASFPMDALIANANNVMAEARTRPELSGIFTQFTTDTPMLELSINRNQLQAQNVDMQSVFGTLQTYLGSNFVNQFVLGDRLYRVFAQAEADYRSNPEDINRLYVRSRTGANIPLSGLVSVKRFTYPPIITNFNLYPSINVQGNPAPGFSTGQAIAVMEDVCRKVLQPGFGYAWTGTAFQEKTSAGAAPVIFGLAFIVVFLVLAAQYESYIDPIIIMITVPLAILGAMGAILLRANFLQVGSLFPTVNNNIYAQVALVMLIGLAAKNAILIVEFANQSRTLGLSIPDAAARASTERLRPILMTAISGLVGFLPLVIASGAGAMSRWSLGTAILGGYLISTVLSLFLVPVLYVLIKQFEARFLSSKPPKSGGSGNSKTPSLGGERNTSETPIEEGAISSLKISPQSGND